MHALLVCLLCRAITVLLCAGFCLIHVLCGVTLCDHTQEAALCAGDVYRDVPWREGVCNAVPLDSECHNHFGCFSASPGSHRRVTGGERWLSVCRF